MQKKKNKKAEQARKLVVAKAKQSAKHAPKSDKKLSQRLRQIWEQQQQHVTVHGRVQQNLQAATINLCSCVPLRI